MAVAADRESVRSRNATERAILDAATQALAEEDYEKLTMDAIAKRAFVSRTAVYFYFDNKRALVDRLIQRAFADMYEAAMVYLDGRGEPRRELRLGLSRTVAVVNRDQHVLLLAAKLSGQEGDVLPVEWLPYITRFVAGRDEAHRARPAARPGPAGHPAAPERAGAARDGREPHHPRGRARGRGRQRVDPRARRAVVARRLRPAGRHLGRAHLRAGRTRGRATPTAEAGGPPVGRAARPRLRWSPWPPPSPSHRARAAAPSRAAQAWADFVYLASGFWLGIVWITLLATLLSVGVGTSVVYRRDPDPRPVDARSGAGAPTASASARRSCSARRSPTRTARWRARRVWARLRERAADPATWKDLGYLALLGPVGILGGAIVMALWAGAAGRDRRARRLAAAPDGSLLADIGGLGRGRPGRRRRRARAS